MFEKIKELFNKSTKEAKKLDTAMKELKSVHEQSICEFESNTNDCSLVQQLKEKQTMKRIVDADIKAYNNHSNATIQKFWHFLITLEKNGFKMNSNSNSYRMFPVQEKSDIRDIFIIEGTYRLERVLDSFTLDDINDIFNELMALKQKTIVIEEKQAVSKALVKDIDDIKTKLGIE